MSCLFRIAAAALLALASAQAQDRQDTVGGVADVQGRAEADREAPDPVLLALQDDVLRADLLRTREDSLLTVSLADGSWFSMDAETEARVAEYLAGQDALLTMTRGRLRVFVSNSFSRYDNAFRVQTDDAVIGVQGTFFIVTRWIAETTLYVIQGIVSVTSTDPRYPDPVIAQAGQFVRVPANAPPSRPITVNQDFDFAQSSNPYAPGPDWGRVLPPGFALPVPVPAAGSGLVDRAIRAGTAPPPPPPPATTPAPHPHADETAGEATAPTAPGAKARAGRGGAATPGTGPAPAPGKPVPGPVSTGRPGPAPGKQDGSDVASPSTPEKDSGPYPEQDPSSSDAGTKPDSG